MEQNIIELFLHKLNLLHQSILSVLMNMFNF